MMKNKPMPMQLLLFDDIKPSKARMRATTVYLTEQQRKELYKLSQRTKVPAAAIIRSGVDQAIADVKARLQLEDRFIKPHG